MESHQKVPRKVKCPSPTSVCLAPERVQAIDAIVAERNRPLASSVWSRSPVIEEAVDLFLRIQGKSPTVTSGA